VSRWTVSRAFTDGASVAPAVRERILEVATELGYRPNLLARGLIKRRTHLIGVVVDELANPNQAPLLDEVSRQLQRQGHLSILLNISEADSTTPMLLLADQFQVDGLIFLGTVLTEELVRLAQEVRHIPLVVLYRSSEHPGIQVVATDNERAGREIAALVAAEGVQRIAYMAGPPAESTQLRRLDGFRDGLAQHGLHVGAVLHAGHYRRECGELAMAAVLDGSAPDAWPELLFCENDILAIGAADLLRKRGLLGRIGLIGFDNIEQAGSPAYDLTTYHQPMQALVTEAVRRVVGGESATSRVLLPGELMRRSSHRRPAA
jgi:LacI family transcriptional regulator